MSHTIEETTIETSGLEFAALTCGDGDDAALLLHGFPDSPHTFEPLLERLADAGYTAVAPYMRGYGDTERPAVEPGNYTPLMLGSDVFSLLGTFDDDDPLVVGHDWGAIAATTAAASNGSQFGTCVTMAVPPNFMPQLDDYAGQALRSWYMTEFQIPGHGEDILRRDDFALIDRLWRLWSPDWTKDEAHLERIKETFRTGETVEAALMYYRDFFDMFLSRPRDQLEIGGIDVPTLLLAGAHDGCISADLFETAPECYDARVELEVLNNAGHFHHAERPDAVADRILSFVDS
ncbi:alpha/beta fold hydrolase [Halorientalis litorea]|uniref:alpha/beta fold hydrolase n=1 Tax=Halorientalis litorea TaxID=2931977 RepID=UPI001FF61F33|nr:alpha/beta hydrolase [Halorientalis litorea]